MVKQSNFFKKSSKAGTPNKFDINWNMEQMFMVFKCPGNFHNQTYLCQMVFGALWSFEKFFWKIIKAFEIAGIKEALEMEFPSEDPQNGQTFLRLCFLYIIFMFIFIRV